MQHAKHIVNKIALVVFAVGFLAISVSSHNAHAASAGWELSLSGDPLAPQSLAPQSLAPTQPRTLSVERAIRIVRQETGGRVLAAQPGKRHGRNGVKVRILLDGARVSNLFVDADGRIQRR